MSEATTVELEYEIRVKNVSHDLFNELMLNTPGNRKISVFQDTYFTDLWGSRSRRFNPDGYTQWTTKARTRTRDTGVLRYSRSTETHMTLHGFCDHHDILIPAKTLRRLSLIRKISRTTIDINQGWFLELSQVRTFTDPYSRDPPVLSMEVEFEYRGTKDDPVDHPMIMALTTGGYTDLLGTNEFIGPMPCTLEQKDMPFTGEVAYKSDGIRRLVVTGTDWMTYRERSGREGFIGRKPDNVPAGVVIDTEYVHGEYIAFTVLYMDGARVNTRCTPDWRPFTTKEFYPHGEAERLIKDIPRGADGLIFVRSWHADAEVYKWKPRGTIDLKVTKRGCIDSTGRVYTTLCPGANGTIYEFELIDGQWEPYGERPDKIRANAPLTIQSVLRQVSRKTLLKGTRNP